MKKGQIQQVFIYIITIIVVGLILLIGYRSIGGLMKKGCDVEMTSFKSSLESYISKYDSYGDLHKESIKVPCSYREICFINTDAINNGENLDGDIDLIIKDSVSAKIQENVFLVKTDAVEPFGTFFPEIKVDNTARYVCMENMGGRFYIKFHGLGKQVNISSYSPEI
ncbi:hypothetical protein ACFLTH_12535 [Bacteroidota bacterium]